MDFVDRVLASRGTPVHRRPWEAAFFFVEHFILEVSGMSKDDIFTHVMFRDMVRRSRGWYVEKYGQALLAKGSDEALGLISMYDTPFELRFPLTLAKSASRSGVTALHFPRTVLSSEDSLKFLVTPPNLRRLSRRELAATRRRISRVVALVRQLHIYVMLADVGRQDGAALAAGVGASLERGVQDLCSGTVERRSSAVWEFNFAAEKALKTYLWQKSKPVPKTHDVPTLIDQAMARGLPAPAKRWTHAFPSTEDAVRHRYGELPTPTAREVIRFYDAALRLCRHCAESFRASIAAARLGAVLYLKSPWDNVDRSSKPLVGSAGADS